MKKRILAAILSAAMTFSAVPTLLPAADISVSAAKSEKLAAPKSLKVSKKTDSSVTLKWSKVEGADKYAVYRYDGGSKKYVKIKNVSKTSYTVTELDSDTKYSFKVAALVKGKDGKYTAQTLSKAKSVTTAEYPSFVMPEYGAKKNDVLKSMGKNRFVKSPANREEEAYMGAVTYQGKTATCVLVFNEKDQILGYVMVYNVDSKKEYNKICDGYDEKYGEPISENSNPEGASGMWMYTDAKKKAAGGMIIAYEAETEQVTETFAYVYDDTGALFDGVSA